MISKPRVTSTLEEDFKALGLEAPAVLSEGVKAPKKAAKGKKVMVKKAAKKAPKGVGKRSAPLLKVKKESVDPQTKLTKLLSAAKQINGKTVAESKDAFSGMERVTSLIEEVQDILVDLNESDSVDIVKGFENVAAIYKLLGKRFTTLAESFGAEEFATIGAWLTKRAGTATGIASKLEGHLSEGRGSKLDTDLVEAKFREHVQVVLEGLDLFSEMEDMMKSAEDDEEDPAADDAEGDDAEGDEGDSDDAEGDADDDFLAKKVKGLPKDGGGQDMPEGDDDLSDEGDDADGELDLGDEGDAEGDDAEGDEGDLAADGDDDFLKKLPGGQPGGPEEEYETDEDPSAEMGADDMGSDDDAEGDESDDEMGDEEGDDSDDDLEEEEGDDEEEDEDDEEVEEDVVDTSADGAKLLGTKVPQRDEGDSEKKGKIAIDNDAGHGGSEKDTLMKGLGLLKKKMESKIRGKGKRG